MCNRKWPCSVFSLLLQVYPEGIRHIRADKRVNEWKTPGKRAIIKCALNDHQVVIALTGGEIVYFEMDLVGECVYIYCFVLAYVDALMKNCTFLCKKKQKLCLIYNT